MLWVVSWAFACRPWVVAVVQMDLRRFELANGVFLVLGSYSFITLSFMGMMSLSPAGFAVYS